MSAHRRSRKRKHSLQRSSTISNVADNIAPLEIVPVSTAPFIRYAETDQDTIMIHQFLLEHAKPAMLCPVNHGKSAREVWRVCTENVGIMVFLGGELVGTLGLMEAIWWYGDDGFLTDRWHFVKPEHFHGPAGVALLDEAKKIAAAAGRIFIHQGKIRGEKHGVTRMTPRLYTPESA